MMEDEKGRIRIPRVAYQGDDRKLKERVFRFKAGTFRIAVFTLVGLFMGYHSHTYVTDSFFPTKLIMAVPYKIMKAIYGSILRAPTLLSKELWGYHMEWDAFPYSALANLLAEPFTTMLIGGAIYGSFAYFTGDKRVFTLQRFMKFAGCWCALILLVIGAAFGVNEKARADNEKFGDDARFYFHSEDRGASVSGDSENARMLREHFFSELAPANVARDFKGELPLGIYYDDGMRYGFYMVNYEMRYVVTEKGRVYHISEEFAQMVADFVERGTLPGAEAQEEGTE